MSFNECMYLESGKLRFKVYMATEIESATRKTDTVQVLALASLGKPAPFCWSLMN
jgi:hypothetical protein